MLAAVNLDNEPMFDIDEVEYVRAQWVLPSESSPETTAAQTRPEQCLCICGLAAQISSEGDLLFAGLLTLIS
jgi:hypothetical protein